MSRCAGIRTDGGRCKAEAMAEAEWCWNHHPDYEQARRRRASKGGRRAGRGRPLLELQQTKAQLNKLCDEVLAGTVDRGDASVANQLLNTFVRCISTELQVREQLELRERLEQLEALIDAKDAESANGHHTYAS
jgi:hypothetical protein